MDARNNPIGELNQFLYTQCYDQLCAAVSTALGCPITAIIHKNQIRAEVDENSVYYVFQTLVEFSPEKADDLRLTVKITFDGHSYDVSVIDIFQMVIEPYVQPSRYGIETTQNLIPDLHSEEKRELEAERFLRRYCPEALATPMPIPIKSIMEEQMGLNVIADIQLLDDAYGQIMYSDDDTLVMNDEGNDILILPYKRGDVLVDGHKAMLRGIGAMNFTLAHEAYHWFAHRIYVDFHRLIGKQGDSSYNGSSRYSSDDILEIQANAMASRILMPRNTMLQKYKELNEQDISALADFFHVSYTAAAIRLSQLGLYDFNSSAETINIPPADACEVYFTDDSFRELVDAEKIVYVDHRYVFNDPKYVELRWEDVPRHECSGCPYRLTEYAELHPDEAFIQFSIDYKRVLAMGDNVLQARSDAHLRAKIDAIREHFPSETEEMGRHAARFEQLYRTTQKPTFCKLAKQMIDYRYGRMEDFDPDQSWYPEIEMPETHEAYFSDDEEEITWRYQHNHTSRVIDPYTKRIIEEASSPVDLFCADTLQTRQLYEKIMKGTAGQPDARTLMSLCVGLCLSPKAAVALFKAAGRYLSWERTDMAYRYILTHLRGKNIEDVNVFLDDLALDPLGAKKNTK